MLWELVRVKSALSWSFLALNEAHYTLRAVSSLFLYIEFGIAIKWSKTHSYSQGGGGDYLWEMPKNHEYSE